MNGAGSVERDLIFISKATPGDDQFVLWLAPRLEAAGYKVFADIFDLDAGDEWRGKLTAALQTRAIKMLLCCSDETLHERRGVREEIAIAEDLTKQLQDPNFIIPLKVHTFQKLFGIGGLQYVDFESQLQARDWQACSSRLKGSRCRRLAAGSSSPNGTRICAGAPWRSRPLPRS